MSSRTSKGSLDAAAPARAHGRPVAAAGRRARVWTIAAIALFAALLAAIVRLSWLGDDAFITLRTVENWLAGHGPRWNVADRVQTYTHPLWMLLLAAGRALTGEGSYTTVCISVLLAALAALVLARLPGSAVGATVVLALLLGSRTFVDYSTSGLETPLTFLLLAVLCSLVLRERPPLRRLSGVACICGLAATNRMDLLLLVAPSLLVAARPLPLSRAAPRVALGLLPLLVWIAFATLYYGTPIPVTAHAKAIDLGIPLGALLRQGLHYFANLAVFDPVCTAVLAAGIGLGLVRRDPGCRGLTVGALLYCAYVVKIGGDFMAGRFAAPPFVVAVAIVGRAFAAARPRAALGAVGAAALLVLAAGPPAWLSHPHAEVPPPMRDHGIVDERSYYHRTQALLSPERDLPRANAVTIALRENGRERRIVDCVDMVGRTGYQAGPLVHVVDPWLCDPVLTRLPVADPADWRIGHFDRKMPEGYLESVRSGENRVHHAGLARFFEAMRTVNSAPVFDPERLRTMWQLWWGGFDEGLQDYIATDYRSPPRLVVDATELTPPVAAGTQWFEDPRIRIVYWGGLDVRMPGAISAGSLRVLVSGQVRYRLTCRRSGRDVGRVDVDASGLTRYVGLQELRVALPQGMGGFDSVLVDVPEHPSHYVACVGGIVPVP